jgi:hypothetical protein
MALEATQKFLGNHKIHYEFCSVDYSFPLPSLNWVHSLHLPPKQLA